MRRIVTAVDDNGRSYVQSDQQIPDEGTIWTADPNDYRDWASRTDAAMVPAWAQPPPGGVVWALAEIPALTESFGVVEGMSPQGIDSDGFHINRTIDLIVVLEGSLVLDLDYDRVDLRQGDLVVLQAGRHAWRNPGSQTARIIDAMISALPPE